MRWFASSLDLSLRRHADHGAADLGAEVVRDRTLGWESRPFRRWQNLEFRVGDNVTFSKSQGAH